MAAVVDNATWGVTNAREYAGRVVSPENAADFNAGLTAGDVASVFIGGSLTTGGASGMEAGIATMGVGLAAELPSGGSSTVVVAVGAITIALGATAFTVGTGMLATASSNLGSKKGQLNTSENQGGTSGTGKTGKGRGKNNRTADPDASGDHTVINKNGHTTYKVNDRNPNKNNKGKGFQTEKRVDYKGASHRNKANKEVDTPHVHEKNDVRPATNSDLPKQYQTGS